MRSIDIFVSSCEDVQTERALSERLVRSVAAELKLPITICYSNRRTKLPAAGKIAAPSGERCDEGVSLHVCFSEDQEFQAEKDDGKYVPNTGQYDAVICIVWSRLGAKLAPPAIMPNGTCPPSATDYEVAWALDQANGTPGVPALHVYRNRSTPVVPLEPRAERDSFYHRWDAVQEFFTGWAKNPAFAEACREYRDLGEFENVFRKRFRDFVIGKLQAEPFPQRVAQRAHYRETNPFCGLACFEFADAPFFYGRTKAVGEVLDAVQRQTAAKQPFVLVLGPRSSGTSSLVRAGVLPLLTQIATTQGAGPWRYAITRPSAGAATGDPFGALAAALLANSAFPECPDAANHNGWRAFAVELREHPQRAVLRLTETMNHLGVRWLNQFLDEPQPEPRPGQSSPEAQRGRQSSLWRARPKVHLALVVDQLEELFTGGVSPELQRKYIATLAAFVRCQRVCVIATLRTDFYASFQKCCGPDERDLLSGRFELYPPGPQELVNMIRLPAEAVGLRYESDPETGRSLDVALVAAAAGRADGMPLLEHLLSRLYRRQQARNDGLLRWSDYRDLGELEGALSTHAESAFSALNSDAQAALKPVIRQLAPPGLGNERLASRRTVSYRDLTSSPDPHASPPTAAKCLVDQFIKEGLFRAERGPNEELAVSVTQEALLWRWSRVRHCLEEGGDVPQMREQREQSLKSPKRRRLRPNTVALSVMAVLTVLAAGLGVRWLAAALHDGRAEAAAGRKQRSMNLAEAERPADQIGRNGPENAAALAPRDAAPAPGPDSRGVLEAKVTEAEARARAAEQNAAFAVNQRDALQAELKGMADREQAAQKEAALASSQRDVLQAQLKESEASAQLAQKSAAAASSQRDALQARLNEAENKAQAAAKDADQRDDQIIPVPFAAEQRTQPPNPGLSPQRSIPAGSAGLSTPPVENSVRAAPEAARVPDAPEAANGPKQDTGPGKDRKQPAASSSDQKTESLAPPNKSTERDRPAVNLNLMSGFVPRPSATPSPSEGLPGPAASAQTAPSPTKADGPRLQSFVWDYIRSVENNDVGAQRHFFANEVNFYGQGSLARQEVQNATRRYHREWPVRRWTPRGRPKIVKSPGSDTYQILQPFHWTVSNGLRSKEGDAVLDFAVEKGWGGEFRIVSVRQLNR